MKTSLLILLAALLSPSEIWAQATDTLALKKEALELIHSPAPTFKPKKQVMPDARTLEDLGFSQPYKAKPVSFTLADGITLKANKYEQDAATTVLLLHGVLNSSYTYNKMSGKLRTALNAEVYALDLRGHGFSGGTPGDIDFIDQYADDVKQVLQQLKKEKPENKIILAGHSMGGGIALRMQLLKEFPDLDGLLLFAPHLGHDAPTLIKTIDKESTDEPFLKVHYNRIVGITMLNSIDCHEYDSLAVLYFSVPETMPLRSYTYRSNYSMAPQHYAQALQAVQCPLLVIAGTADEAFVADQYPAAVKENSKGEVHLIEGATHNGIRHEAQAMKIAQTWAKQNSLIHEQRK